MDMENDIENPYIPMVTSLTKELDSLSSLSSDCCIYRVPEQLRYSNEKAYAPQVVSIGPLHHGKERLKPMEEHKRRYLRDYLHRTNVPMEDYIKKIKNQEARLRSCYEETIEFSSDEFVTMILVDAAFIIELLLTRCGFKKVANEKDRIFNKPRMINYIVPDMLLLENQLPFFILEDLFDPKLITLSSCNSNAEIEKLSITNFSYELFKLMMDLGGLEENLKILSSSSSKVEHFLDFIRSLHLPLKIAQMKGPFKHATTPCMTELHQVGIKFKKGKSKNLFDITFIKGILEIPTLRIHDHTELILRNLLAFEQCHCVAGHISNYVVVLLGFVNTRKDVEILVEHGIIENMLGDNNQVSTLINNLGKGVVLNHNSFFHALFEDLNKHCNTSRHKWTANLRQKYLNTPWTTISVIAASFLLILTLIQAACSITAALPSKNKHN